MKMLLHLYILIGQILLYQSAILNCDFETDCNDFSIRGYWGKTDGNHPQPLDHDHTLKIKAGYYIYYDITPGVTGGFEILTKNWSQPSTERFLCFQIWYYSTLSNILFSIETIQGEGLQLYRTLTSVGNVFTNDWTLANATLPNEKLKIHVTTNVSRKHLIFDDISVDYCDGPAPTPTKILYSCDFESSCSEDFVVLSTMYPYQWLILNASDANKIDSSSPSIDYTFGNQSGHYAFVPVKAKLDSGNVGYLHLQQQLQIVSEQSYCLNFEYYAYPASDNNRLKIYAWSSDESKSLQELWLGHRTSYLIPSNQWGWGILNLPVGNYSLLFRVDTYTDAGAYSFAVDNIEISSCDYPPSYASYDSLLSFSCDFDKLTMCDMINDQASSTFNFTALTPETIPHQELGPDRDHTSNSTTGGFIYWNCDTPGNISDQGRIYVSKSIEQNNGMCVRFAYYVKSKYTDNSTVVIRLSNDKKFNAVLWYEKLADSQGWQTVTLTLSKIAQTVQFYFEVYRLDSTLIAVAFDDIQIDQCSSFIPTTTTTITTTTTTITDSTASTPITATIITSSISTESTSSFNTTTPYNTAPLFYVINPSNLIVISFLFQVVRHFFLK